MRSRILPTSPQNRQLAVEFANDMAEKKKAWANRKISTESDRKVTERGKEGEFGAGILIETDAKVPAYVDITAFSGGDGHMGDLLLPSSTASVKTRRPDLPPDFILAPKQGTDLLDDIGIVMYCETGKWTQAAGFITREDWHMYKEWTTIPVPKGVDPWRWLVRAEHLRDWSQIGETIQIIEDRGRERGIRQGLRRGGMFVRNGEVYAVLDNGIPIRCRVRLD